MEHSKLGQSGASLPNPICEWCGMEVDPEDTFQNTETPDGWFHDSCLDEKNIEEADDAE